MKLWPWGISFAFAAVLTPVAALAQPYYWSNIVGSLGNLNWANGTNSSAGVGQPSGVAIDAQGNLYISDFRNNVIGKVTHLGSDWVVTTLAGATNYDVLFRDGTNSHARFYYPQAVALDGAGNLYVADSGNNVIRKVSPIGTNWVVTTIAGWQGATPTGIAVDSATNLYVADLQDDTIRKITPIGTNWVTTTLAGLAGQGGSADGTNSAARFNNPNGVAVDAQGNLYVTDYSNYTIRQITPVGTNWVVTTIAGTLGEGGDIDGTNTAARFTAPEGVAVDGAGNVYVADFRFIRKLVHIGTNWVVTTLTGPTGPISFGAPNALLVDPSGKIYVADTVADLISLGQPAYSLQFALSGNQLLLSWPIEASNYVLQATSTLGDAADWLPLTNGISLVGITFVLTNTLSSAPAFFRLVGP